MYHACVAAARLLYTRSPLWKCAVALTNLHITLIPESEVFSLLVPGKHLLQYVRILIVIRITHGGLQLTIFIIY